MRTLLLLLCATIAFSAQAQVHGNTKDADGKPLSGVTISLMKDTGKAVIKLAVSKEDGSYSFIDIKAGNYRVSATHVGFQPSVSKPFAVGTETVTAPELNLVRASGDMKGIVVTATKPIVEVKADKTILNVEGTINSVGSDALELLRKSPGVMVDKDDNLSLSGKNGVQVYVDGRPTPLTGADLANYLKSLQSSNIESIELITNPSAKYEAAGNAGIINIRLKKNKSFGTNGSVNAGWNIGTNSRYNGGISLNHRNAKVNIFGNYNYNRGKNDQFIDLHRSVADSVFDQHSSITANNESHNFKAGIDYFINKKSTLGAMVNGTFSHPAISNYSRTEISYQPTDVLDRILVADNHSKTKRNNISYNLNYNYNGTDGKTLAINADRGDYKLNSDQYQPNFYYDATGHNLTRSVIYDMVAPTDISINSIKLDWEQNYKKGKLGLGGKTAFIKTDNDFQRYNVISGNYQLDMDRSNRFQYTENINALYVNYNRAWKGVMVQGGLRMENTVSEGKSSGQKNGGSGYTKYDSTFHRHYTDLFPSAAVTFNKNPMSQVSFTYSRRIDRPYYQDLNPFEFKLDEYTFQKGNINLRPQYTNSFGVTHTYKYRLNTTVNYSHVKDMFVQLPDTAERTKAFISKRNLATQDIVSLNMSYPYQYKSFSVFGNMNANYSHYKADFGPGRLVDLEAFGFSFYAQNSLKFAKVWTAEVTGFYNAPTIYQGAFKAKSLYSVDGGLSRQLFGGKGTLKAAVSDIFHTLKFRGTTDFAGQTATFKSHWESQQFKLNFVYRFGSSQVKGARQRSTGAEDELKRTQGGSGIAPGGQ
jgi:hypothetical protein